MTNAKEGFKKLYTSELLLIASAVVGAVSTNNIPIGLASVALMIAAFFISLKGLSLMSLDDEGYKKAQKINLYAIYAVIAFTVLEVIFANNATVSGILSKCSKAVNEATEFVVAYLILKASIDIFTKQGNNEMVEYISKTLQFYQVAYVVGALIGLIDVPESIWALLALVVAIAALILIVVAQIKYIKFLKKMSETL